MQAATSFDVVMLGDGGVGKSALVIMLTQHEFTVEYNPVCHARQARVRSFCTAADAKQPKKSRADNRRVLQVHHDGG